MSAPAGVVIEYLGGNCPVQAEGTFDGKPFYFRARGTSVTLDVGEWEWRGPEYEWPYAGWISETLARAYIHEAYAWWESRDQRSAKDRAELRRKNDFMARHMGAIQWAVWLENRIGEEARPAIDVLMAHAKELLAPFASAEDGT